MRPLLPLFPGVLLAALSGGCAMSLPDTMGYAPSPADPTPGFTFCSRTESAARSLASAQAAGGWTFGVLGAASTGVGTFATLVNSLESRRIAAAGLMLGGVGMGIVAYNLFLRSATSSKLAEAANLALVDRSDRHAFDTCVRTKAAWAASKTDPDGITRELYDEVERENRRLRERLEHLEKRPGEEKKGPGEGARP